MALGFWCRVQRMIDLLWFSSNPGLQCPMSCRVWWEALVCSGGGGWGLEKLWKYPDFWFPNVGRYATLGSCCYWFMCLFLTIFPHHRMMRMLQMKMEKKKMKRLMEVIPAVKTMNNLPHPFPHQDLLPSMWHLILSQLSSHHWFHKDRPLQLSTEQITGKTNKPENVYIIQDLTELHGLDFKWLNNGVDRVVSLAHFT